MGEWVAGNNSRMCNKWLVLAPSFTLYLSFCLTVCVIVAGKMWRRPPLPFLHTAKSAPLNWAIVVADPLLFSLSLVLSLPSIFLRTKNCGCWCWCWCCCCRCRPRCFVFAGNLLHSNWWARRECWGREKERTSFSFCLLRAAAAAAFRFLKWRWYFIITCLQAMDGMLVVVVLLQSVYVIDVSVRMWMWMWMLSLGVFFFPFSFFLPPQVQSSRSPANRSERQIHIWRLPVWKKTVALCLCFSPRFCLCFFHFHSNSPLIRWSWEAEK